LDPTHITIKDQNPKKSRPKKNPALSDLFCLIKPARDFNPRPGFFLPTQSLDQIHTSVALEKKSIEQGRSARRDVAARQS
jgi:hypothetical protein